ncbi:HrpE/YscL family type III secretion apparatus protein [Terasakiella pusilla]|jgi:type III secretion protein L|uniref:HrpE/YscL family type III secretion apparatus protein n=1 Tax=Terasakiella pusilla TaxID=64973 RepID=UPI00068FCB2B|nr:HrpE/YscL family type III secretion apparatus protein [Terasakiella pusilla]
MARYIQLNTDKLAAVEDQKILKASDYATLLEANAVLDAAKAEAEQIRKEAESLYESEKQRGYEDGLFEAKMEMTEQMITTVEQTVEYLASVEQDIVNIVTEALEKVVTGIDAHDLIVKVVRNALQVVRSEKKVSVRVAPQNVEVLNDKLNEILALYPAILELQVQPDSRLNDQGCIIESPIGIVDASLDGQLDALKMAFQKAIGDKVET